MAFGVWYYSKITDQAPPFRVKKNQKLTTDKKRPTPNWPLRVKTPTAAVFGDPSARQLSKPKRLALHFPESRFKHKPHMARRLLANAISQTIFTMRAGPQHRDSIDYEHPSDSMRRYAELLAALRHDCARPRHSYYRAMRVLHEHFLGEPPAHPRRGGKPEVKERRYPPLDGALGVRPVSAAASAFNAYAVA